MQAFSESHRFARTEESIPVPRTSAPGARFQLLCPDCGGAARMEDAAIQCLNRGHRRPMVHHILPLLAEPRRRQFESFLRHYRTVRRGEGWGGGDAYYLSLPFADISSRHTDIWRLRARSFRAVVRQIQARFPGAKINDEWHRGALSILELGAGNGWFSWRMAESGHFVLAADISLDEEDGLGALERYSQHNSAARARITLAQADMESVPLQDEQFDIVVAAGSLHYARRVESPIAEAHRLLRSNGVFFVVDSPTYADESTGLQMVRRRDEAHARQFGARNERQSAGFLIQEDFLELLRRAGFSSVAYPLFEGCSRTTRRLYCRLRGLSPPARFPMFVATKARAVPSS